MRGAHRLLSDSSHPLVVETARNLVESRDGTLARLETLFLFVRDRIAFDFPTRYEEWDRVNASHVITAGYGYCNTKSTLLVAMCGDVGIAARVLCGQINAAAMRGVFPSMNRSSRRPAADSTHQGDSSATRWRTWTANAAASSTSTSRVSRRWGQSSKITEPGSIPRTASQATGMWRSVRCSAGVSLSSRA